MSVEEQVRNALRALAEHDRQEEAPAIVEARVLRGFRQARKQRMLRRAGIWSVAIAAAIIAVLIVSAPKARLEPLNAVREPVAQPLEVVVPESGEPLLATVAPKAGRVVRREIVTQFFMLTDSTLPLDRGQLLRVRVPASVMYSVGLPVNPDRWTERVDADVVVGEEGMARAIRFVGYEQ